MKINVFAIKLLMIENGLTTQTALAEAAGTTKQNVCNVFAKGRCSMDMIARLAAALHTDPEKIVMED